jgi:hypothetical protein
VLGEFDNGLLGSGFTFHIAVKQLGCRHVTIVLSSAAACHRRLCDDSQNSVLQRIFPGAISPFT